jgi:GMP synthase (glutamine-hydrolysing)
MAHQLVTVVDFGGQYTQLIARRVRECGCYSEVVAWSRAAEAFAARRPDAVILSGGPRSVLEPGAPDFDFALVAGLPVLGICYGMQLMAHRLGGTVRPSDDREYGRRAVRAVPGSLASSLTEGVAWMSHGDQVVSAPAGWSVTAETDTCPIAAFEHGASRMAGVQFHPEVSHTPGGKELLWRFLRDVAGLSGDWTPASFLSDAIEAVRAQAGSRKVLCAVSGGVDSSVAAAIVTRALPEQVTCVFVDHGLLRKDERAQVERMFTEIVHPRLVVIDASEQFFQSLKGVTDPEEKRKRIGAEFVRVFEEHQDDFRECELLVQGTLYPDVVESGSPTAAKIKTHHNVGGLPDWMRMEVVEPLKWLFKDEVRAVGRELGLPAEVVDREPFPGPGLAVRVLGEVTPERVRTVQEADAVFREELAASGASARIWQSYAALLDVRSVGVMGDERTYEQPIVLRAVESEDAMTARASALEFSLLEHVATRIVNEVPGVNRVLYDLTSKPPATIEWE